MIHSLRLFIYSLFLFFGLAWSFISVSAQPNPPTSRVIQQVKSFDEFSLLENQLLTALQRGNKKDIAKLLDVNFEYIAADSLEQFNTTTQFLDATHQKNWNDFKITALSIRAIGESRLISFYLEGLPAGSQASNSWAVQDYWVSTNGSWKLLYRFTAPKNHLAKLPPAYLNQETINKRF